MTSTEPQQVTADELAAVRAQLISHSGDIREACLAAGIAHATAHLRQALEDLGG